MPLGKIDKRKKLSKGRVGVVFITTDGDVLTLPMGTVITDTNCNMFRVAIRRPEDGEYTPLFPLSEEKNPSEKFEYREVK
jgi:hypothetical protein